MRDYNIPNIPPDITRHILTTPITTCRRPIVDTPETRADRDQTVIAAVVALSPADVYEANLAAQIAAAHTRASTASASPSSPASKPDDNRRHRSQAAGMMRVMRTALRWFAGADRNPRQAPSSRAKAWSANLRLG